ncbi:unnamed protein product [Brassica oleracea]
MFDVFLFLIISSIKVTSIPYVCPYVSSAATRSNATLVRKVVGHLICTTCDFDLCYQCATYPSEVRYKHDEHPLTLCYGETVDAKYWCEICEKELDSTKWFYTCNKCCVTIHLDCMFGFFVRMKPGFTFGYNGLMVRVLGNTSSTRPICDGCEQRCPAHVYYKVYWRRYKLASCSLDCLNQVLKGRICKQELFP